MHRLMPPRPNIIVLLLDTARAQNFSCYGYDRPTSPHIAAIAHEGVIYEQAIATGCWSLPSQVSLLTGMFPTKHGAHELHLSYAHHYPLLPEVLRAAGYSTLGVSTNSWMTDEFGVTHGFDQYLKLWQLWRTLPDTVSSGPRMHLAKVLNRLYWRYLFPRRNRARDLHRHIRTLLARTPEPFFLYAVYWDMHLPYTPRSPHTTRWLPSEVDARRVQQVNRNHLTYLTDQTSMSEEDFVILRALYDSALASIDEEIGMFVAALRQQGLLDRTLLIITSDHGENIGEHGLMSHAYSLHDTLIRVPLIIRYPECFPAGQRVAQQVQLTDLFPTVLDVLQLDVPEVRQELQGVSLLAPLADVPEQRLAYAEMLAPHPSMIALNRRSGLPEDTPHPAFDRALRCLRTRDTKLIWASDGNHALYDLHQDPYETVNRFTTDPERATTLLEILEAWHPPNGVSLLAPTPTMNNDIRQRLRDLGYLA
jgi:arylsulfatase A-like enzyme